MSTYAQNFIHFLFFRPSRPILERSLSQTLQYTALMTGVLLVWVMRSPLEELTRTDRAIVVPQTQNQVIQSLEGGLIKSICVQEGQSVLAGEVLAEIDDLWAQSQLEKNLLQIQALEQRAARLESEMDQKNFDLSSPLAHSGGLSAENEYRIYLSRQKEIELRLNTLDHEIAQLDHQIHQEQSEHYYAKKSYELKVQEYEMILSLMENGAVSAHELLIAQRALSELEGMIEQIYHRMERSLEHRESLVSRKDEFLAQCHREAAAEYAKVKLDLQQLYEEKKTLVDKERRTQLRAPVSGLIHKKHIHTAGAVLRPGETLFEMVPSEESLIIEAKIHPKDIGFIHKGMEARVKVSAYDFAIYGGLAGTVQHISPDVMIERDQPYYLVKIETEKKCLEKHGRSYPIIPGMMASVDILTGHRTVWDYLMKPIIKSTQIAMTER